MMTTYIKKSLRIALAIFLIAGIMGSSIYCLRVYGYTLKKHAITWPYAYASAKHGFDGVLYLTKTYGENNLAPNWNAAKGATDWLYPTLLPAAISMYQITHDEGYLDYARSCADAIGQYMLNDKNIIREYSKKDGASDTEATDLNFCFLSTVAELAIYDPSYRNLAQSIAEGIIDYGLSQNNIPYRMIYPNGIAADRNAGLSSNGWTVSITITGLLRTYEATGNTTFLHKAHDILMSIWNNKRTSCNLVPTMFDADTLETIEPSTQLYATGELLRAYSYYYFLTRDPSIRDIISVYATAAYDAYWDTGIGGNGYFVYQVDTDTGQPSIRLLETNWHKLDMSFIYAGEITGNDYTERVYQDMNTHWLGKGLSYKNHLFRHLTRPNGRPGKCRQALIYASIRTADYVMLRMLNSGVFRPSNAIWNDRVWKHIEATRYYHYHDYGYHSDLDIPSLKPDPDYWGLSVLPACGEFASLVTLMFSTTPNVKMIWETFPHGDYTLEPFPTDFTADNLGFMTGVFMDYAHNEVAFRHIKSNGEGKIYCSSSIAEVRLDGETYTNWQDNVLDTSDGEHEYIIIFEGGSYVTPVYPVKGAG